MHHGVGASDSCVARVSAHAPISVTTRGHAGYLAQRQPRSWTLHVTRYLPVVNVARTGTSSGETALLTCNDRAPLQMLQQVICRPLATGPLEILTCLHHNRNSRSLEGLLELCCGEALPPGQVVPVQPVWADWMGGAPAGLL